MTSRGERHLLAVPSNTTVRDLEAPVPAGKRARPFQQVRHWAAALPPEAWTRIDVRDAHHGPLVVEVAMARVVAKTDRKRIGPEEVLLVLRVVEPSGALKYDYYLSNAAADTPCEEFARVAKAEHRIEECIQRAKSEAGLADYEVRSWVGWHHHQTLSLISIWFLVQEARRGTKSTPALTVPQVRTILALMIQRHLGSGEPELVVRNCERRLERTALARWYRWKNQNLLAPLHLNQRR